MGNGGAGSNKVGEAFVELGVRSRVKKDMADAEKEARSGAQKVGDAIADVGKKKPAVVPVKAKMAEEGKDDIKDGLSEIANQFARFGMGIMQAGVFVSGGYFGGRVVREQAVVANTLQQNYLRIRSTLAGLGYTGYEAYKQMSNLDAAVNDVRASYRQLSQPEAYEAFYAAMVKQRQPIQDYQRFLQATIGYAKQFNISIEQAAGTLAQVRQQGKAWELLRVPISENVSALEQYNAAIGKGTQLFKVEQAIEEAGKGRWWIWQKSQDALFGWGKAALWVADNFARITKTMATGGIRGGLDWVQDLLEMPTAFKSALGAVESASEEAAKAGTGKTPAQRRRRQGFGGIPAAGVLGDQELLEGTGGFGGAPSGAIPGLGISFGPASLGGAGEAIMQGGGLQSSMESLNSTMRELIEATKEQIRYSPQQQEQQKMIPADLSLILD